MAFPVSVYAIFKWETIVPAVFLSKEHKYFAGSIEVVVMVIDVILSWNLPWILLHMLYSEHLIESESTYWSVGRL